MLVLFLMDFDLVFESSLNLLENSMARRREDSICHCRFCLSFLSTMSSQASNSACMCRMNSSTVGDSVMFEP